MNYAPKPILPEVQLLKRDTTLPLNSKSAPGVRVKGYHGPYTLYVVGRFKAATPTTGVQTGVAGVGTTTTSVVKPTGAANWTNTDTALAGKWLRVLRGGGVSTNPNLPTMRKILTNNTTTLTVKAISGMDETTEFDIVDSDTVVGAAPANIDGLSTAQGGLSTCVEVSDNTCRVVFVGCKFTSTATNYHVFSRRNRNVSFYACDFAGDPTADSFNAQEDGTCQLYDCGWSAGAGASIQYCNKAIADRQYMSAADGIAVDYTHTVVVGINATSNTGNTVSVKRANNVTVGLAASSCAATPAVFETCQRVDISGGLTGTGNTGYGVDVAKGGVYNLAGATITGTLGDFVIDGISHASVTWAAASSYGAHTRWGNTLLLTGGANTTRYLDNALFEGNMDVSGSAIVPGSGGTVQFGGREIIYGYFHFPFTDSLTAHAGGGQGSATALGLGISVVTVCATNGDSVILPSNAAIGGFPAKVINKGASDLAVFPPVGGKINGGAANASVTVAAGTSLEFTSRNSGSGLDWVTG